MIGKLEEFPPSAPPIRRKKWNLGPENCMGMGEIYQLLQDFVGRDCQITVSSRRYSVERYCWHFRPLSVFSSIPGYLTDGEISHCPLGSRFGDEQDGDENAKQTNNEGTAQVRGFLADGGFLGEALLVWLSSFLRWDFAR